MWLAGLSVADTTSLPKRETARLRLAFVGWGAIARTVAALLDETTVEVIAVAVRDGSVERPDLPTAAQVLTTPDQLAGMEVDVVAEAASRDSVGPWGRAALHTGADFIISSVSALADADLLAALRQTAVDNGSRLLIQPGALAGVEALSAARSMGIDSVEHRIIKPPLAWAGTPAEALCDLTGLVEPTVFFAATAAKTASEFPKNANVAMTTALAGIGPDQTQVTLIADPSATTNRHELAVRGGFGKLDVSIANYPLPANPKTSAMAALSLVRAIENRVTPIVI